MSTRKDSNGRNLNKGEYQRKDNYAYRHVASNGQVTWIYAKTLIELRKKEQQLLKDSVVGVKHDGRRKTLAQVATEYLESRVADVAAGLLRQTTYDGYVYNWKMFFDGSRISKLKIAAITTKDIQQHYKNMLVDGKKIGTCETAHVVLSGIFKYAYDQGYCEKNVARGALTQIANASKKAATARGDDVARCLDITQRAYLLQALETDKFRHYGPIIRLMLHTGLRIGEVCGLTSDDVDNDMIRVRRVLKYCHDENGHMTYKVNPPKSATSRRDVPLSLAAQQDLMDWFSLGRSVPGTFCGLDGLVFCTPKQKALTYRAVNKVLRQLVKESNGQLPDGLTCHWLRHTFVCDAIDAGVPIAVVSAYVGHEDTKVTTRVYYQCRPNTMQAGLEILNQIDVPKSTKTGTKKAVGNRETRVRFHKVA